MKLRTLLCSLFLSFSMSSFAHVPIEQCFDLYQNTLDEHKDISPAWTQIMLLSGQIPNIRFLGNYVSKKQEGFNPHPAFTKDAEHLKNNAPRDPIAALFQYLFPSTDGAVFAINERQNDPVGHFKKNLSNLSALLTLKLNYDENLDKDALSGNISALVESLRGKNDRSKKTREKFDPIRDSFSDIFVKACIFEHTKDCQDLYPKNIVTHALLAYALLAANSIDEIYKSFPQLFCAEKGVRDFSEEDYNHLIANLSEQSTPDTLIRAVLGKSFYEEVLPQPLRYANVFFVKDGKKITYPNCGETTLLNFFYYLWGDRGIINPDYIQETEHKLSFVQDSEKTKNWTNLKNYFLAFKTINSSNAKEAQERWSHLLSDLNTEDTHPSLRIIYRQKNVCNIQGIGFFNILNTLEKILPDEFLSETFSDLHQTKFKQAEGKFDRLCELFSREGATLDWKRKESQEKELTKAIDRLTFRLNKKDHFVWEFKQDSFHLEPVKKNEKSWQEKLDPSLLPDAIRALVCSEIMKHEDKMQHPSDLFAFQLRNADHASIALDVALHHKKWHQISKLIPQIIGKTLYTNDQYARRIIYTLLHPFDEEVSPELHWKTYVPEFTPPHLKEMLRKNHLTSFWWTTHYSVKENYEADLHLYAARYSRLEPIKRIVEVFPKALTQKVKAYGCSIFSEASESDDICAYTLSKLIQNDCYTDEDCFYFLEKLIKSNKDNSKWIQTYLDSERSNVSPEILYKKYVLNDCSRLEEPNSKNIITFVEFLLSKGLDINTLSDLKTSNGENFPNWINYAVSKEIFEYFTSKGIKITPKNGEFLFQKLINLLIHKSYQEEKLTDFILFLVDYLKIDLNKPFEEPMDKRYPFGNNLLPDQNCNTYLLYVAQFPELALRLIEKGADPLVSDSNGNNLLHILLSQEKDFSGLVEQIDELARSALSLDIPNNENVTPLEIAFLNPKLSNEVKKSLLKTEKTTLEKRIGLIFCAAQSGSFYLLKQLFEEEDLNIDIQDNKGNTLLHYACASLSAPLVNYLLEKGASPLIPNHEGLIPLHLTMLPKDCFISMDYNNEIDVEAKSLDELETAVQNQIYILKLMSEYGVDLNTEDQNGASLFLRLIKNQISFGGESHAILFLIKMGVDTSKKDRDGNHFWHYLLEKSHLQKNSTEFLKKIYIILKENGIHLTTPNHKGVLPLMHLQAYNLDNSFCQFLGQIAKELDLQEGETLLDYLNPYIFAFQTTSYDNIKTHLFPCFSDEALSQYKNKIYGKFRIRVP